MAWPLTPYATFVDGAAPPCNAAFLNAVEAAVNGLYAGTASVLAAKADGVGNQAFTPAVGQVSEWQSPGSANVSPLHLAKDSAGRVRWLVDHNGFPMGRRSELRFEWVPQVSTSTTGTNKYGDDPRITTILAGTNAQINAQASSNNGMPKTEQFQTGSTAGKCILTTTGAYIPNPSSDTNLIVEVETTLVAQQLAAGNDIMFGLSDVQDPSGGTGNQIRLRQRAGTNGNWWLSTISGGGAEANLTDSGIAVATNTPTRIRIEVYGSLAWPGSYQIRAYVNETLIGPLTATLPAGSDYFAFAGVLSGNGSVINGNVGPIVATWNHYLTLPLL